MDTTVGTAHDYDGRAQLKKGREVRREDQAWEREGGETTLGAGTTKTPAVPFSKGHLRRLQRSATTLEEGARETHRHPQPVGHAFSVLYHSSRQSR